VWSTLRRVHAFKMTEPRLSRGITLLTVLNTSGSSSEEGADDREGADDAGGVAGGVSGIAALLVLRGRPAFPLALGAAAGSCAAGGGAAAGVSAAAGAAATLGLRPRLTGDAALSRSASALGACGGGRGGGGGNAPPLLLALGRPRRGTASAGSGVGSGSDSGPVDLRGLPRAALAMNAAAADWRGPQYRPPGHLDATEP